MASLQFVDVSINSDTDNYITVTLVGAYDVGELENAMVLLRTEAQESGRTKILVDAFGLDDPRIDFDRFRVGVAIAEHAPPSLKIACYLKGEAINHFGEHTAVNRGAQYKVFAERDAAVKWLLASA